MQITLTQAQLDELVRGVSSDAPRFYTEQTVRGTALRKVGWRRTENEEWGTATLGRLSVTFKSGHTYDFDDVPFTVYAALVNARSAGRMFHRLVKGRYHSEQKD